MIKRVLAFDLGGSSGRAVIGIFDGSSIKIEEVHRFSNDPVLVNDTLYWDILRLLHEIKQGIIKAHNKGGFDSIGIDTWGVDFGLINKYGNLIENPVHYRDKRTNGMLEKSFEYIPKEEFYDITGNQFLEINTAFQLLYLAENQKELLEKADKMLLMPDLLAYFLTGKIRSEYTIASTTQLMDIKKGTWSDKVIEALGIPRRIFPEIITCGDTLGNLNEDICTELGIPPVPVISIASHDTQSAMIGVPTQEKDFLFISCGTWSLVGTELEKPIINQNSQKYNITNEGSYGNKISFLKNINGLWLIQESRRQWIREGNEYSFSQLEEMAKNSKSKKCYIDPDNPELLPQGDIPNRIEKYCEKTNQPIPKTPAEILLCINESLALKYRNAIEEIENTTKKTYDRIHIIGGGSQSKILCQLTADCCGKTVVSGPVEATVLGNIALQILNSGEIKSVTEARNIISNSNDIFEFNPKNKDYWDVEYKKFKEEIL